MALLSSTIKSARRWLEKDWIPAARIAVISIVLFASLYIAPRVAKGEHRIPVLLFLLYLVVVAAIIFLRWPNLGLILVMLGAVFVPFVGPGGFNIAQVGVAFLLVIWLLDMVIRQKKVTWVQSRVIRPILFFLFVSILAFGMGQLPWYTYAQNAPSDAQLGGLVIVVLSIGVFLFVANMVRDLRWLQAITWVFIGLGGVYITSRLLGLGFHDRFYNYGFAAGSSMFWTWLMALTFGQAFFNKCLHLVWRGLLWVLVAATLYVAYVQGNDWKSGWLPPLVCIAAMLGIRYWKQARFLSVLAVIPVWYVINQAIATDEYSWGTRVDAWLIVTEIAKVNPLLGMGFANYYWYTPLFPIRGYRVSFNSHSQFVDLYAQTGILGVFGFLWIFGELGWLALKMRLQAPEGFARAYTYGVLGGLVGTLVAALLVDWVLPFVYNIGMNGFRGSMLAWIFMGGLVALEQIVRNKEDSSQFNLA